MKAKESFELTQRGYMAKHDKKLVVPNEAYEAAKQQFTNLRDAVRDLYYAAHWTPDRPLHRTEFGDEFEDGMRQIPYDAGELWTAVRDAAGFPKGGSPKALPYDGVRVEYPTQRLRLLGRLVTKAKGGDFGTEQTKAFLLLHSTELRDRIDKTVRDFLSEKLA
jgi:hypothetical protein